MLWTMESRVVVCWHLRMCISAGCVYFLGVASDTACGTNFACFVGSTYLPLLAMMPSEVCSHSEIEFWQLDVLGDLVPKFYGEWFVIFARQHHRMMICF